MNEKLKLLWVTAGGVGLLPKAPGTWGSIPPVLVVLICGHFELAPRWVLGLLIAIIIASSIATIVLAQWYTVRFAQSDPQQVVSDEVAGQSIALLGIAWLEPNNHVSSLEWILLVLFAFTLFRIFDIWKPFIIDHVQQLSGGWGVLADDILAGVVAGCIVFIASVMF